jgi:hypothetical protein
MSDTYSCEVCGRVEVGDPDHFCYYCQSAVCSACWWGQGDNQQGHELAEHKHEMRRKDGRYELD